LPLELSGIRAESVASDADRIAIVRLGDVVVAKAVAEGSQELVIETVSPEIARALEKRPELLTDPEAFIAFVSDATVALPRDDAHVQVNAENYNARSPGPDDGITGQ
jgi:hypothetical protein